MIIGDPEGTLRAVPSSATRTANIKEMPQTVTALSWNIRRDDAELLSNILCRLRDQETAKFVVGAEAPEVDGMIEDLNRLVDAGNAQPTLEQSLQQPLEEPEPLFTEEDLIHRYTREQAIQDGVLHDVTGIAREAGFSCPAAITAALWADINDLPGSKRGIQDPEGRLWDVVYLGAMAARRLKTINEQRIGAGEQILDEIVYRLTMHVGRGSNYAVKLKLGGGDRGELIVTLMRPEED